MARDIAMRANREDLVKLLDVAAVNQFRFILPFQNLFEKNPDLSALMLVLI